MKDGFHIEKDCAAEAEEENQSRISYDSCSTLDALGGDLEISHARALSRLYVRNTSDCA